MSGSFTLLDGGMGKLLLASGAPFRQPEWSALALMEGPGHVVAAHRAFVDAGADVITTNNYAVVPYHLGAERFDERAEELIGLAGELAREVADTAAQPVRVAGSVPPLFGSYEPGQFDADTAPALLRRIAAALAPHVDLFLAETQSCIAEAAASAAAARSHDKPLWLSVTLADDLDAGTARLRSGESVGEAASLAADVGAEALLFNCSPPEVMEPAIIEARHALPASMAVGAYANAFEPVPEDIGDDYRANNAILDHRPELDDGGYTAFVTRWLGAGAEIVGGCCGIMPPHIALLDQLRTLPNS